MVFKELKNDLIEADADIRSYVELSEEYIELKIFKVFMRFLTSTIKSALLSLGILFVLLFLSIGASLALCEVYDSYYLGFVIVAGFYLIISAIIYIFRKQLNRPLLAKFSTYYFEKL
ncbi:hypothetical protein ACOCEA_13790 [Maribacter sp. CXY002]|uniref:hypothetical protein n=1 Tax=Maribacter luteocoastalis TaxID=3407671 RepID=UPI003B67374D